MPYIKPEAAKEVAQRRPQNAGELNYMFTIFALDYFKRCGANYQAINDIMGAFEGAKMEFYRRLVAPYENKKAIENGDVYLTTLMRALPPPEGE